MKKCLLAILITVMLLASMPVAVFADPGTTPIPPARPRITRGIPNTTTHNVPVEALLP